MLNCADECRQRADECRRDAAQVADDVLRGTYLDLGRRWRMMAQPSRERWNRKYLGRTTLRITQQGSLVAHLLAIYRSEERGSRGGPLQSSLVNV